MKAALIVDRADGALCELVDRDTALVRVSVGNACGGSFGVVEVPTLAALGEPVADTLVRKGVAAAGIADMAAHLAAKIIEDGSGDVLNSLAEEDERAWEYICVQGGGWLGRAPVWRLSAVTGWTAWHIADAWCRRTGRRRARPGGDIRSWALEMGLGVTCGIEGGMDPERCAVMLGWK